MNIAELEEVLEATRAMRWSAPPAGVRRATRRRPSERPVPRLVVDAFTVVRPGDVRSSTVVGEPHTLLSSHSSPDADVSLALTGHGGLQRIEGRVWRVGPARGSDALEVLWVHDDHVLGRHRVGDGEMFRFEGAPVRGWTLEVWMPGDRALVLTDPTA